MATAERAIGAVRLDADDLWPEARREMVEQVAEDQGVDPASASSPVEAEARNRRRSLNSARADTSTVLRRRIELVEESRTASRDDEDDEDEYEDEEIILDGAGRPISETPDLTSVSLAAIRNELRQFHGSGTLDPSNPNSGAKLVTNSGDFRAL